MPQTPWGPGPWGRLLASESTWEAKASLGLGPRVCEALEARGGVHWPGPRGRCPPCPSQAAVWAESKGTAGAAARATGEVSAGGWNLTS